MSKIVHLALWDDGTVVAVFLSSDDAAKFCTERGMCHVPFNADYPTPAVGSKYVAGQ